jgi:hypothetical protein
MRPTSGDGSSGSTTAAVSRLAASTWAEESLSAVRRMIAVRRGSTASMVTRSSGQVRTSTQSPAQGSRATSRDAAASTAPARLARTGPSALSTVQTPRSTRATRPGTTSASNAGSPAEYAASQPRDARSKVMGAFRCWHRR